MDVLDNIIDHLSASSLYTWNTCPRQYYYRYIRGLKEPPKGVMILGGASHVGNEVNYRQKMQTREDLPVSQVQEVVADAFHKKVQEAKDYSDGVKWENADPGAVLDQSVDCAGVHVMDIAPLVQPVSVEEKVEYQVNDELKLVGFIDVIDDKGTIIDNKYVGKAPPQSDADQNLQLTCYSTMTNSTGAVDNVRLDAVVKNKTPVAKMVSSQRTEKQREAFIHHVLNVFDAIKKGSFVERTQGWHCSEKHCGYWHRCGYGGGTEK